MLPASTVVELSAQSEPGASHTVAVAADGTWRVEGLAPGWFGEVRAWATGFNVARGYVAIEQGTVTVPDLVLGGGASVKGRVVTESGQPISGAPVVLLDETGVAAAGFARADGAFRLDGLTGGPLLLVLAPKPFDASPLGFARRRDVALAPLRRSVTVPASGELDLGDVALGAARAVVSGHVFGPDGRPASAAQVSLRWLDVERTARADSEGAFRFAELAAGTYELAASRDGLVAAAPITVVVGALDSTSVDLTLVAGGSITGVVAGPSARVARLMVRATSDHGVAVVGSVGTDGRFQLKGLARGAWRLRLEPTLLADVSVTVVPDREVAASFPEPSGSGRIRVTVGGAPAGFSACAFSGPMERIAFDGRKFSEVRGHAGRATLEDVPAGTIGVAVSCGRDAGGLFALFREGLLLREGEDATVAFELPALATTGSIAGRVERREAKGLLLVTAWGEGSFCCVPARTDSTFRLDGLPEGRYRLVVLHLSSGASREPPTPLDVKRGETTTVVVEAPATDRR
ncbi:MAG: carboxypeptidase regulatory-like domain-containing protein [Planctomycetota bacterium]